MKQVIKYQCDYCYDLFDSEERCLEHEERHKRIDKANQMLNEGRTLKEIQDECNIWRTVPEYLENVTIDNCFIVSYLQCCDKPAYQIKYINFDGKVKLWGCGSWSGYYGSMVSLEDMHLKKSYPKEKLFVYKRYSSKW